MTILKSDRQTKNQGGEIPPCRTKFLHGRLLWGADNINGYDDKIAVGIEGQKDR
jgi:hypothetical protein